MKNEQLIQKMLTYANKINNYCTGYSYDKFNEDLPPLVEACVFNLSQLEELCRLADSKYMQEHPEIPWHELYGLRNRIVHDYEGVNLNLIWQIINEDLPPLITSLQNLSVVY